MVVKTSCAVQILCGLSAPIRAALVGAVSGLIGLLELQAAKLRIAATVLNIATLPMAAMGTLLQAAADQISAVASLVPVQIVAGCADLGTGVEAINAGIEFARADIDRQVARINRNLAYGDQLQSKILLLEAEIRTLNVKFLGAMEYCDDSNA